jgi:RNA polymerase sigma-70 factor (ECF subfamily)
MQTKFRQFPHSPVSYTRTRLPGNHLAPQTLSPAEIAKLYERHGGALTAYACSFVSDFPSAEDVVHQVFLNLLREETMTPDMPIAYLYRAVRNRALNARRTAVREIQDANAEIASFAHTNREAALALKSTLADLPDEQREVVIMRIWSGLTLNEISAVTSVSLNTVASRYRYALEKLRERLEPYRRLSVIKDRQ